MKKVVFLPYDMDTAIGINNEGALVFSYTLRILIHWKAAQMSLTGSNPCCGRT